MPKEIKSYISRKQRSANRDGSIPRGGGNTSGRLLAVSCVLSSVRGRGARGWCHRRPEARGTLAVPEVPRHHAPACRVPRGTYGYLTRLPATIGCFCHRAAASSLAGQHGIICWEQLPHRCQGPRSPVCRTPL